MGDSIHTKNVRLAEKLSELPRCSRIIQIRTCQSVKIVARDVCTRVSLPTTRRRATNFVKESPKAAPTAKQRIQRCGANLKAKMSCAASTRIRKIILWMRTRLVTREKLDVTHAASTGRFMGNTDLWT